MRRRDLLASTVAACTLAGCVSNGDDDPDDEEDDDPDEPDEPDEPEEPDDEEPDDPEEGDRVEIVESELVREETGTDEESVVVRGLVATRDDVNDEDVEVNYVEVRAVFLDAEGETLDTIIEQVEIDPEVDRWEFEIAYPHMGERAAEVEDYELEVGTEL